MDPGDLLLFDAIMTEGGIAGASRKLGEPKATISRRLQRLEKAAGAPLFDRTSRRLRPTALGHGLSAPAAAIRVALASAHSVADATRLGDGGSLRIASPFLFGQLILAPLVGRFIARRAKLNVTLKFANESVDPLRDDFDLAIQINEPTAKYLVRTKLISVDLKLYAPKIIAMMINEINDLKNFDIVNTSNSATDELLLRLTDGHRTVEQGLRVACTVNDPEAACCVAAGGAAVAALPEFLARTFVERGELMPILPAYRAGSVTIIAVTPPGRLAVPLVRSFMTALKKEMTNRRFF